MRAAQISLPAGLTITGSEFHRGSHQRQFADGSASARFDLIVDGLRTRTALASQHDRDLACGALWTTLDLAEEVGFDEPALQQRDRRSSVMAGMLSIGREADRQSRAASSGRSDAIGWINGEGGA